jgi:indolepyruvate ferredoxin oxidoreductase beta subunit
MNYDILIAGVGGQGLVLSSRLIGAAAIGAGLFARTSETIGMSQRGGCVVSNVRIGDEWQSPVVPAGEADLIIGSELCETVRNLAKLKPHGSVILNSLIVNPITVSLGMQEYHAEKMMDDIKSNVKNLLIIDAGKLAIEAGSVKAGNVVLLGAAAGAGYLPISVEQLVKAIDENVPPKYRELNKRAFEMGYQYAKSLSSV